jgi:NTP pyrophosphatase (non-canonical NTP hydrolase)
MVGNEYQKLASRTNDGFATDRLFDKIALIQFVKETGANANLAKYDLGGVMNACLGLAGEVGELNDMIKKWVFHEKELDETHLKKELGDVMWYVAMMCQSMGWELDDVLQMNIDKLIARYPEGFDVDRANHRQAGDV